MSKVTESLINFLEGKTNNGKLLCAFILAILSNSYIVSYLITGSLSTDSFDATNKELITTKLIILFASIFPCISLVSVAYTARLKIISMGGRIVQWSNERKNIKEGIKNIPIEYRPALQSVVTQNIFLGQFLVGPLCIIRQITPGRESSIDHKPKDITSNMEFNPEDEAALQYLERFSVLNITVIDPKFTRYTVHPYAKKIYSRFFHPE